MLHILTRDCQRFELKFTSTVTYSDEEGTGPSFLEGLVSMFGDFSFGFPCFKQSLKYHNVSLIHILLELWWRYVIFFCCWFEFFCTLSVLLLDWRRQLT